MTEYSGWDSIGSACGCSAKFLRNMQCRGLVDGGGERPVTVDDEFVARVRTMLRLIQDGYRHHAAAVKAGFSPKRPPKSLGRPLVKTSQPKRDWLYV